MYVYSPRGLFPYPTEDTDERKAIEETKEKPLQKLLAISKSAFQKCFEDWKKPLA